MQQLLDVTPQCMLLDVHRLCAHHAVGEELDHPIHELEKISSHLVTSAL
jgi:hypothetical protein